MRSATVAAVEVAEEAGLAVQDPVVLHETNNTVVWLRPEPVIAKVGTRPVAAVHLRLEHAVATELAALGSGIAAPLRGAEPETHRATGFTVTLWERVPGARAVDGTPGLADALLALHQVLAATQVPLPSFRSGLAQARAMLDDATFHAGLPPEERAFLRETFDDRLAWLDDHAFPSRRLHGEPHEGNRLQGPAGITWIDFENCCLGPVEWDLVFMPASVVDVYIPEVDRQLLAVLLQLNSARTATWCCGQSLFPQMQRHGDHHLRMLHHLAG